MSSASRKKVTVKAPGEIEIKSVVSAILARGSDDADGVKVCSVKKIKDFIIGQFFFSYCSNGFRLDSFIVSSF